MLLLAYCYTYNNSTTTVVIAISFMFKEFVHDIQRTLGKLVFLIPVIIVVIGFAINVHGATHANNGSSTNASSIQVPASIKTSNGAAIPVLTAS